MNYRRLFFIKQTNIRNQTFDGRHLTMITDRTSDLSPIGYHGRHI